MKKKICILTTVHPVFDGRIFQREGITLSSAGYEVFLIATHNRYEDRQSIRIIPIPKKDIRLSRMFGSFRALNRALRVDADIYHFHDPELIPIGLILKIITRAKVIYDVHEDHAESMLSKYYLPKSVRRMLMHAMDILEKSACRYFDHILPATEAIQRRFIAFSTKTTIIHNYPKHPKLPLQPNDRGNNGSKEFTLICTGGFSEGHGTIEEVQCIGLMKDLLVRLKLIGKFQNPTFEGKLKKLPEFKYVDFIDWLPPHELYEQMMKADLGLVTYHPLPNMTEALPTKIFEYMSIGLPIVASNFPLWKELVEKGGCGITVDPMNPVDMAKKIKKLLSDKKLLQIMSKNGKAAFQENYNWEKEEWKLLTVYENLIGKAN